MIHQLPNLTPKNSPPAPTSALTLPKLMALPPTTPKLVV